jgi:acyl-CoA synthetase (NDP forming)
VTRLETPTGARLRPLLEPASIAVIGASGRPGRPGHAVLAALRAAGFAGAVHPVTPTYDAIEGWACLADPAELPAAVDLAVIAGAAPRVPEQLAAAIAAGARSAFVLANAAVADASGDTSGDTVLDRVRVLVAASGIPLLGPNSLGFVNFARGIAVTWTPAVDMTPGPVALVAQSGSTYSYANNLDPRIRFSFTAHAGQEVSVGAADLIRYGLALDETRVVALYLETAAVPDALAEALAEAAEQEIPVVAIRPGRSERSQRQIETHAGRMAGSDAAFEALFRAHGVARTTTVDEWWATIALLAGPRRPARGGVAAVLCSGGARALLLDDASDLGVPLAEVSAATRSRLAGLLTPGTPAENPVDVWDGQADLATHATDCLRAVADDGDTALAIAFTDFGAYDPAGFPDSFATACRAVADATEKPVAAATYTSRQFHPAVMLALADRGIPVLDGMRNAVAAAGHALAVRDFQARRRREDPVEPVPAGRLRRRLADEAPIGEAEALALLRSLGVPVPAMAVVDDADAAARAAAQIGYPVVLKAAAAGHKSDVGGVLLGLASERAVRDAHASLAARLGPRVTVAAQVPAGVEVAAGVVRDPQFGPVLMVAAGGELVEMLDDRRFLLAPAPAAEVARALRELRIARLLAGARGRPPCDVEALARTISRISAIAVAAGEGLAELDVNPIIASPDGCHAVDALIVRAGGAG